MESFDRYTFAKISSSDEKNIKELEQTIENENAKKIVLIAYEEKTDSISTNES